MRAAVFTGPPTPKAHAAVHPVTLNAMTQGNDSSAARLELEYRGAAAGLPKPVGFIVAGVLFALLAAGAGCFTALIPVGLFFATLAPTPVGPTAAPTTGPATVTVVTTTGPAMPVALVLASTAIYLLAAVGFTLLAIGCFRARGWVRPVIRALAWPTVLFTAIMIPIVLISMSTASSAAGLSGGARVAMFVSVLLFAGGLGVALPLWMAIYFGRPHVRNYLSATGANTSSVSLQPAPMVGLWLWPMLVGLSTLPGLAFPVMAVFGIVLTGPAAIAVMLAGVALLLVSAWLIFHGRRSGALLLAALVRVGGASQVVSILRLGPEVMASLTLEPEQRSAIEGNPMLSTPLQLATSCLYVIVALAAVAWAARYVCPSPAPGAESAEAVA